MAEIEVLAPGVVPLRVPLAGPGGRAVSATLDAVLVLAVASLAVVAGAEVFAALALGLSSLLAWEVLDAGRSPGKRWRRLQVTTRDGRPPSTGAVLVRGVTRLVDGLPGVAPAMILLTDKHQRLGDLVAGTVVSYRSRPPSMASALQPPELGAPRGIDLQPITEDELALVRRFLLRRPTLTMAARATIGKQLATRIGDRLPALEGMAPEELLEAVAVEAGHRTSAPRGG